MQTSIGAAGRRRLCARAALLAAGLMLAGCAATPPAPAPQPLAPTRPAPHFKIGTPYKILREMVLSRVPELL